MRREVLLGLVVASFFALALFWQLAKKNPPDRIEAFDQGAIASGSPGDSGEQDPIRAPLADLSRVESLSENEKQKFDLLLEIIKSGKDNDPRLDGELRNTSQAFHRRLEEHYHQLAEENRAARGMIAFLMARDIQSEQDASFLKGVLEEYPCQSMQDCRSAVAEVDEHGGQQTTLVYPQLAAISQLERRLAKADPALRGLIIEVLESAQDYPVQIVSKKAKKILNADR